MKVIVVVALFYNTVYGSNMNFCQNLNPVHDFDEEALLGMWYIHEYIYHKDNITKTDYNPNCPIIQIRNFKDYVEGGLLTGNLVSDFGTVYCFRLV